MKLYGIPNCDTVKKARAWLDAHNQPHSFHDFRKDGVDAALLQGWMARVGWEILLNRQGTTWRKLPPEQQAGVTDAASAHALLLAQPSLIKRPVIVDGDRLAVGFKADTGPLYR